MLGLQPLECSRSVAQFAFRFRSQPFPEGIKRRVKQLEECQRGLWERRLPTLRKVKQRLLAALTSTPEPVKHSAAVSIKRPE